MFVAALPQNRTKECCTIIEKIFDIKTSPLPNYLNITLTPSNPILHTTRLRILYKDYQPGAVYTTVPLFYEDWNNETSELLLKCDAEVQNICKKLSQFDLSLVKSLKTHYESNTVEAMTKKISSITSPTVCVDGGYIPDFNSRYFTSDFSYGLTILIQIADFAGVKVPNMKDTLNWYYDLVGKKESYQYSDYGIYNANDFVKFYSK